MQHVIIHRPCLQLLRGKLSLDATVGHVERCLYREIQRQRPWHRVTSKIHLRGAKSKTTIQRKDLPQGILESDGLAREFEDDGPAYPMMIQQARNNMRKFSDCVLLTRVGGFYEVFEQSIFFALELIDFQLYFEHAEKYGPLLNLKIAQKKTTAGLVSMVCHFG